jgi:hypothetical protein
MHNYFTFYLFYFIVARPGLGVSCRVTPHAGVAALGRIGGSPRVEIGQMHLHWHAIPNYQPAPSLHTTHKGLHEPPRVRVGSELALLYALAAHGQTGRRCRTEIVPGFTCNGTRDRLRALPHRRLLLIRDFTACLGSGIGSATTQIGAAAALGRPVRRPRMERVGGYTCIGTRDRLTALPHRRLLLIRDFTTCLGSGIGSATTRTGPVAALGRPAQPPRIQIVGGHTCIGTRDPC